MKQPTLYSRDTNGKILQWSIEVSAGRTTYDEAIIVTSYGELKGKKTSTSKSITKGKNIGRSNETTPLQQALNEAFADWKNKRKKGYKSLDDLAISAGDLTPDLETVLDMVLPIYKTDLTGHKKPMKCQPYKRGKMKHPCIAQPKVNGGRIDATYEKNQGKDLFDTADYKWVLREKEGGIVHIAHIEEALKKLPNTPYDGEIYLQNTSVSKINGAADNPKNPVHHELIYVIFDTRDENLVQVYRTQEVEELNNIGIRDMFVRKNDGVSNHYDITASETPVVFLNSVIINSDIEAEDYRTKCIAAGFEGCVIRDIHTIYKFGSRPISMMKLKVFIDAEFEVLAVVPQEKDPTLPLFVCKNDINALSFEATPTGSHEFQRTILINKDKWIGKFITVKFAERTEFGLPFHTNAINLD